MKIKTNTINRVGFFRLLSFTIYSINNSRGTEIQYEHFGDSIILTDTIFFKNGPLLIFMVDNDYNCHSFDSEFISEEISDNNYVDFLLDIYNILI